MEEPVDCRGSCVMRSPNWEMMRKVWGSEARDWGLRGSPSKRMAHLFLPITSSCGKVSDGFQVRQWER